MNKKFFVSAFLVLFLIGCGAAKPPQMLNAVPIPQDKPLYGITTDGVFFLHDAVVKNIKDVKDPGVVSEATNFRLRPMKLMDEYWVYGVKKNGADSKAFDSYKRFLKIKYLFVIGPRRHLPDELIGQAEWLKETDYKKASKRGFVFITKVEDFPEIPRP